MKGENGMQYTELRDKLLEYNEEKNKDIYIISSIGNKGVHIGRIKNISLDANDDIVIETDIEKESETGPELE